MDAVDPVVAYVAARYFSLFGGQQYSAILELQVALKASVEDRKQKNPE